MLEHLRAIIAPFRRLRTFLHVELKATEKKEGTCTEASVRKSADGARTECAKQSDEAQKLYWTQKGSRCVKMGEPWRLERRFVSKR
jgi:hypothetical protein